MPLLSLLGYIAHYCIGPDHRWWGGKSIAYLGIRYSLFLGAATALGVLMHWGTIKALCGKALLVRQEKLMLIFLALIWLSVLLGDHTVGRYAQQDHPSTKMTKVIVFALLLTHIVARIKDVNILLWVLVLCSLVLGWQAYNTPHRAFVQGRLESVGGADFAESNVLAAFLAAMLPLIAMQFMRVKWKGKLVSLASGVFATNAIVLTRSRGAVLGLLAGAMVAVICAPPRHRLMIVLGLIVMGIGGYRLMDEQFLDRASTINKSQGERDRSAESRLEIWRGSVEMLKANPLGVGAGNFYQKIGSYATQHAGRDAHNTFVRCYSELGIQGFAILIMLIVNAFLTIRRCLRRAEELPEEERNGFTYAGYGLALALVTLLACGVTVTLLYVEILWWVLALPVCLERALENRLPEEASESSQAELEMAEAESR